MTLRQMNIGNCCHWHAAGVTKDLMKCIYCGAKLHKDGTFGTGSLDFEMSELASETLRQADLRHAKNNLVV